MSKNKYPEVEQTLVALQRLDAENRFVSFISLYKEVKRIRLERNLKAETDNTLGRVCRSLYFQKSTATIRESEQSELISIAAHHPFRVEAEKSLNLNEKGLARRSDIIDNRFKLIPINS